MTADRLGALSDAGVSIWLDDLSRKRLESGSLARDVAERHVVGVTSNPSIFAAAVKGATEYDAQIAELAKAGATPEQAVQIMTANGAKIMAGHTIDPAASGSRLTLSIGTRGLVAAIMSPFIKRVSVRNMKMEAEGLKRVSESD